jgi:hypothetical protein
MGQQPGREDLYYYRHEEKYREQTEIQLAVLLKISSKTSQKANDDQRKIYYA